MDPAEFRQWSEGFSVIRDASYTGAARSSNARDVEYYRAFAMPTEQHGKQITVMSAAGAVCNGGVEYSDKENAYSIRLIGDGAGPEIKGLEKLAEWRLNIIPVNFCVILAKYMHRVLNFPKKLANFVPKFAGFFNCSRL